MKNLITIMLVLLVAAMAQAQTAGVSSTQSYRLFGFQMYGDSYVHPSVSANLGDVGISAVAHADDAEMDDLEYWDTSVGYNLLGMSLGYDYLILPNDMDLQSLSATIPLPFNMRYTASHVVPDNANKGQVHVIGLDIPLGDFSDPNAVTGVLMAEATYNDGVNPFGSQVVHDWTHITTGLTVNVPMGDIIVQPGVYYQHTFEEIVEPDKNEVWFGVGVQYRY